MHQAVYRQGAFQVGADIEHVKIVIFQQTGGVGDLIEDRRDGDANRKYRHGLQNGLQL